MEITLFFNEDDMEYLREKFNIDNVDDLKWAIFECISTYMEL